MLFSYIVVWYAHGDASLRGVLKFDQPSLFTVWQSIGVILGIFAFLCGYFDQKKANYNEANERYKEFTQLLVRERDSKMSTGFPADEVERFRNNGGTEKSLIIYDQLFSLCEYSFALYGSKIKDWARWESWLGNFFDNDPLAFLAWEIASPYYEKPFVERISEGVIGYRRERYFPSQKEWIDAAPENGKLNIVEDKTGKTLFLHQFQVMQDWEDGLMMEMANAIPENCESVLEVGYGLGICSGYLRRRKPKYHVILEPNAFLASRAKKKFEKEINNGLVEVYSNFWEDLENDERWTRRASFQGIVFDGFPLNKHELRRNHYPFFPFAARILAKSGIFTFFSDHSSHMSASTQQELFSHFTNCEISCKKISVVPAKNCEYWRSNTILHIKIQNG